MKRQCAKRRLTPLAWALSCLSSTAVLAQPTQVVQADNQQANSQVLQSWQQQTGQVASVSPQGQIEFHGGVTLDAYSTRASSPSGNPALSPLRDNDFGKLIFQGDVRSQSAEQDITYVQGTFTSTNDRSVLSRYATQINSFQTGRAGVGYQLAVGDVVANYSGLSSNLGIRGLLGVRQFGALTVTGVGGTVADSWEALLQRDTLDKLPPRTRYLRDVAAVKTEYAFDQEISTFATLQSYSDRLGSAPLPPASPALAGMIVSAGFKFSQDVFQISTELAHAKTEDKVAQSERSGNSICISKMQ